MAAVVSRGRGRRRSMNEINMVPFIDVMLVLLIIFMVSAPMITTGVVDLPSVGKAKTRPQGVVEIIVQSDDKLQLKLDKGEAQSTTLNALADQVLGAQAGSDNVPVIISAVMAALPAAPAQRSSRRSDRLPRNPDTLCNAGSTPPASRRA